MALFVLCGGAGPAVGEVGRLREKSIKEASGLVASRAHAGVFWTHNDGDDGVLYAIRADGTLVGRFKVSAKFRDWEDIAADDSGNLYLADCGNNDASRKHMTIYRVAEPDPSGRGEVRPSGTWRLSFPAGPFNCEGVFVAGGHGYVISKHDDGRPAGVYRFTLDPPVKKRTSLEHVIDLPVTEPVTAADISGDGKRLAVLGSRALFVFDVGGDVRSVAGESPTKLRLPPLQLEGCCFDRDGDMLLIAESGEILRATPPAPATRPAR